MSRFNFFLLFFNVLQIIFNRDLRERFPSDQRNMKSFHVFLRRRYLRRRFLPLPAAV